MRSGILTGSALALAVLAMGSTQAAACDDGCGYCGGYSGYGGYGGYGYYAASYGYYARPAYAYAPAPYYAAPAYGYYAPAYSYYAPAPALLCSSAGLRLSLLTAGAQAMSMQALLPAAGASPAPLHRRAECTHWASSPRRKW